MPCKTYWIVIYFGLIGCTVGPDYKKPESTAPGQWQAEKITDVGLKTIDQESLKTWWLSFDDPSHR